ncbi:MAG: TRAM domain-containing protein [Ignavibacteria bacterium]
MLIKNQEIELRIDSLNSEGQGVGRVEEGFVVFCQDALPGDVVMAEREKMFIILKGCVCA